MTITTPPTDPSAVEPLRIASDRWIADIEQDVAQFGKLLKPHAMKLIRSHRAQAATITAHEATIARQAEALEAMKMYTSEGVFRQIVEPALTPAAADAGEVVQRPTVVCLCGSTRFSEAFQAANLSETLAGRIVLTIGCDMRSDDALGLGPEIKPMLDQLHLRKIDLADQVYVLNAGGYIGESTRRELDYARKHGKTIRFLEDAGEVGGE